MSCKKLPVIVFLLLLAFSIFSMPSVAALDEEGGLMGIVEVFYGLFGDVVKKMGDVASGADQSDYGIFAAKFVLWILLFSILYYAAGFAFKDGSKSIRVMVPLIIALLGVVAIPNEILIHLMKTYTIVGTLIVWFIPIIGVWIMAHKLFPDDTGPHHFMKAMIYLILFGLMFWMGRALRSFTGFGYWVILDTLILLLFIYQVMKLVGSLSGHGSGHFTDKMGEWGGKKAEKYTDSAGKLLAETGRDLKSLSKRSWVGKMFVGKGIKDAHLIQGEIKNIISDLGEENLTEEKFNDIKRRLMLIGSYFKDIEKSIKEIEKDSKKIRERIEDESWEILKLGDLMNSLKKTVNLENIPVSESKLTAIYQSLYTRGKKIRKHIINNFENQIKEQSRNISSKLSHFRQKIDVAIDAIKHRNKENALQKLNESDLLMGKISEDMNTILNLEDRATNFFTKSAEFLHSKEIQMKVITKSIQSGENQQPTTT